MAQFWFYDGTDTFDFEDYIQELMIGGNKRRYKVGEFLGSAGGFIRGFGSPGPKKITMSRKEKVEGTDITAWNSRRKDFQKWCTKSRTQDIYLRIRDGENSYTVEALIYCTKIPGDKYKNYRISDMRTFEFVCPKGILENISATTDSDSVISGDNTIAITNNGLWEAPLECKFTPTGAETKFGVRIADQFGFVLEKLSFAAGKQIVYNTGDNSLTIDGEVQKTAQFLTSGGVFNLPSGSNDLIVNVSGAGTFASSFKERDN